MKRLSFIAIVAALLAMVGCQKGTGEPVLKLSTNTLEVPAAGGDCSVIVTSNVEYVVNQTNKQDTWVRMLGYTESGENMITYNFRISKNTSEEERSSEVTFIGGGVTPQRLMIVQAGVQSDDSGDEGGDDSGDGGEGGDGGDEGDDPVTPPAPVLEVSVSPATLSATAAQTSAKFNITLNMEAAWTATSNNSAFTVSPASGNASQEVTVSFAANSTTTAKTAVITVEVEGADAPYTVNITQAGNNVQYFTTIGEIAKWDVMTYNNAGIPTWDDTADQGMNGTGKNGKYMPATSGNGVKAESKIEYYAVSKSSYVLHDASSYYTHRESIGKYRRLMVYSNVTGDYWTYTAKTSKLIAPGSKLKFYTLMSGGNATLRRWLVEYKDGDEWKPIKATTTMTETATTYNYTTSQSVNHSLSITYNYDMTDSKKNAFECEFTINNATDVIEIRVKAVGYVSVTGSHVSNHLGASSMSCVGYKDEGYPYISLVSAGN